MPPTGMTTRASLTLTAIAVLLLAPSAASAAAPGTVTQLSRLGLRGAGANGHAGPRLGPNSESNTAPRSGHGRYVSFTSKATNVVGGFTDNDGAVTYDAYVYDRVTGTRTLVSRSFVQAGTTGNGATIDAAISPDG